MQDQIKKSFVVGSIAMALLLNPNKSMAQNVGVGTSTPSAKLEIKGNGNSTTTNSLKIFNSSNVPLLTVQDDGAIFADQGVLVVTHPTAPPAIHLGNLSTNFWSVISDVPTNTLRFRSTTSGVGQSTRLFIDGTNGRVNIGSSTTPTEKLQVEGNVNINGALKFNNVAGAAGQMLVSGGAGAPTWKDVTEPAKVGFAARLTSSVSWPSGIFQTLFPLTQLFEDGGDNLDALTGKFTAPSAGVYFFLLNGTFSNPGETSPLGIRFTKNDALIPASQLNTVTPFITGFSVGIMHSIVLKLAAGDIVSAGLYQGTGSALTAIGSTSTNASVFSGYKIY